MTALRHVRGLWPDSPVPPGAPALLFYEIDDEADSVTRIVELYADGRVTRNSIEIEEQGGRPCPSLIDCSIKQGFKGADVRPVTVEVFEEAWHQGVDTPFWNVA